MASRKVTKKVQTKPPGGPGRKRKKGFHRDYESIRLQVEGLGWPTRQERMGLVLIFSETEYLWRWYDLEQWAFRPEPDMVQSLSAQMEADIRKALTDHGWKRPKGRSQ